MGQLQINFMLTCMQLLVLSYRDEELKSFRGDQCSYQQQDEYFSYRRDAKLAVWQLLFYVVLKNHISS